jgi:cytochrome c-type biogenesis protein CcmH/NrfF
MAIDPATDFGEQQQTHHGIDLEDNRQVVQVWAVSTYGEIISMKPPSRG